MELFVFCASIVYFHRYKDEIPSSPSSVSLLQTREMKTRELNPPYARSTMRVSKRDYIRCKAIASVSQSKTLILKLTLPIGCVRRLRLRFVPNVEPT